MSQDQNSATVVDFRPSETRFMFLVQKLAADSLKAPFSEAAEIRLLEMEISDLDVLRSIGRGKLASPITFGRPGEWQASVSMTPKGRSKMVAKVSIIGTEKLRIKNLSWEES
jgi:hypothetical protein